MTISIGVIYKQGDLAAVLRYLYNGVHGTSNVYDTFREDTRLMFFQTDTISRAQQQVDRLSSGLYGARVCRNDAEKQAMIEEFKS